MSVKSRIVRAIPRRFQTPWRYHLRRLTNRLEREILFLDRVLKDPRTCVDIGASYGLYTYALTKLARNVEAFEPLPECANALEAYFGPEVRVHRVALSSKEGRATLYTPIDAQGANVESTGLRVSPNAVSTEVTVKRLDDYHLGDVSFVKIDVEGHELDVLAGATDTIAQNRPILLVEIEQRHGLRPVQDIISQIEGYGYSAHFLDGQDLRPGADFSYERHQAPYLGDVMARGYINNFFFLPKR